MNSLTSKWEGIRRLSKAVFVLSLLAGLFLSAIATSDGLTHGYSTAFNAGRVVAVMLSSLAPWLLINVIAWIAEGFTQGPRR